MTRSWKERNAWTTALLATVALVFVAIMPADAMASYQWKYRPLLVFAPAAGHGDLARQREIVGRFKPALIDRKVIVVYVVGNRVTADLGPAPSEGADAMRRRFGVTSGQFRAFLVGLDGGTKLSASKPIAGPTLFKTIDAMPMRREEIRKR